MRTINFYYTWQAAQAAAEAFAKENNGFIAKESAMFDDRSNINYCDDRSNNLCWSGESSAIVVKDNDTWEVIGLFAGWCDENDVEEELCDE